MTMTNEEICRSFRNAATPRKQIGILAELNQCDRSRIVDILREGGETLPAPYKQDKPAAAGAKDGGPSSVSSADTFPSRGRSITVSLLQRRRWLSVSEVG